MMNMIEESFIDETELTFDSTDATCPDCPTYTFTNTSRCPASIEYAISVLKAYQQVRTRGNECNVVVRIPSDEAYSHIAFAYEVELVLKAFYADRPERYTEPFMFSVSTPGDGDGNDLPNAVEVYFCGSAE